MRIQKSTIERINLLHGEIEQIANTGLQKAIEVGGLLLECKSQLPHGEFSAWVESNCRFSLRTGQNYMKLHANRDKLTEGHSLAQAYRLLKNETVSLLTWDEVFRILESHLLDVRAGVISSSHEGEADRIVEMLKSLNLETLGIDELAQQEQNMEKAQRMLGESRLLMQRKIGQMLEQA